MKLRRNTIQRQVIREELSKSDQHPTAAELYVMVRQQLPRVSLATVYRNLDLLVSGGMARKLDASPGEARYDGDLSDHGHLRCLDCGRIDDIFDPVSFHKARKPRLPNGWQIREQRVEFLGVCPECQNDQCAR